MFSLAAISLSIFPLLFSVSANVQLRYGRRMHVNEIPVKRSRRSSLGQYLPPVAAAIRRLRPRQLAICSQQMESRLRRYE